MKKIDRLNINADDIEIANTIILLDLDVFNANLSRQIEEQIFNDYKIRSETLFDDEIRNISDLFISGHISDIFNVLKYVNLNNKKELIKYLNEIIDIMNENTN